MGTTYSNDTNPVDLPVANPVNLPVTNPVNLPVTNTEDLPVANRGIHKEIEQTLRTLFDEFRKESQEIPQETKLDDTIKVRPMISSTGEYIGDLPEKEYVWKNKCNIFRNNGNNYIWSFESVDHSGWWFTTPQMNDIIESLYEEWLNESINLRKNCTDGYSYEYDFDKMTQSNIYSLINRKIMRMTFDELDKYTEKSNAGTESPTDTLEYNWSVSVGNNKKINFPKEDQIKLEEMYLSYCHTFTYRCTENVNDSIVSLKLSNGYTYSVNFLEMTQINTKTGKKRAIFRTINNEFNEGVKDTNNYDLKEKYENSLDEEQLSYSQDVDTIVLENVTTDVADTNLPETNVKPKKRKNRKMKNKN
jgi:hypothetical protein